LSHSRQFTKKKHHHQIIFFKRFQMVVFILTSLYLLSIYLELLVLFSFFNKRKMKRWLGSSLLFNQTNNLSSKNLEKDQKVHFLFSSMKKNKTKDNERWLSSNAKQVHALTNRVFQFTSNTRSYAYLSSKKSFYYELSSLSPFSSSKDWK